MNRGRISASISTSWFDSILLGSTSFSDMACTEAVVDGIPVPFFFLLPTCPPPRVVPQGDKLLGDGGVAHA